MANKWKIFGLAGIISAFLSAGVALKSCRDYFKERRINKSLAREIYTEETDTFPLQLGYKVFYSNSSLRDAKVIVLAERHYKDDKKHSEFFRHYIQDRDTVLLEAEPKGENLESFLDDCESTETLKAVSEKMTPDFKELFYKMGVSFLHPELYGIKQSGKKPKILGADDMRAYFESDNLETRFGEAEDELDGKEKQEKYLSQIIELFKKRDNSMISSVYESLKNPGKIYLIIGNGHVDQANSEILKIPDPKQWFVSKLRNLETRYVILVPDRTKDMPEAQYDDVNEDVMTKVIDKIAKARKREDEYKKRFKPKKQESDYKPL